MLNDFRNFWIGTGTAGQIRVYGPEWSGYFLWLLSYKKDKLYDQSFYDKALYFPGFVVCNFGLLAQFFWHIKSGLKLTLCLQCTHLGSFDFSRKKSDRYSKQMARKDQPLSAREGFKAGMKILHFYYFFTNRKSFGTFASWWGANIRNFLLFHTDYKSWVPNKRVYLICKFSIQLVYYVGTIFCYSTNSKPARLRFTAFFPLLVY